MICLLINFGNLQQIIKSTNTTDEGSIPFAAPYGGVGTLVTACFQHHKDTYSKLKMFTPKMYLWL